MFSKSTKIPKHTVAATRDIGMLKKTLTTIFLSTLLVISCARYPSELVIPSEPPPIPAATLKPATVALALGSGGARGYAHIGVIKVLEEEGIPIDLIVGTSSGSLIGALYADTADILHVEKVLMHAGLLTFIDLMSVYTFSGPVSGNSLNRFLLKNMQARDFKELHIPFVSVATNLLTGNAIAIVSGPVAPAVHASTALPGLLRPVSLYGYTLIDGGVAEPVPVSVAKQFNPKIVIAVNIGKELSPTTSSLAHRVYDRAYSIMWHRLTELSAVDADVIIRPAVGNIGTFSISKKQYLVRLGEEAARQKIPEIRALLAAAEGNGD